jgi:hypothetical protein
MRKDENNDKNVPAPNEKDQSSSFHRFVWYLRLERRKKSWWIEMKG